MKLLRLDPSKAYLGTSLFLPKEVVREEPIQGALTFCFGRSAEPRTLARSHPAHVEVPRAFLGREQLAGLGVEVVDMRPKSFAPSSLRPKASFSLLPAQVETWRAFLLADGGVLHLACGGGKTILGLLKAAIMEGPLLVVSAQKAHLRNWEQELHDWFDLDGPVGWVHGKKMEYRREVVFATIQTLAKRVLAGSLPGDFHLWFSTVIYDEAHHMAAEHFSLAADVCAGERYGLTATPVRVDHNEGIVYSHLGRIFHSDVSQELRPEFHLVRTGVKLPDAEKHRVTDRGGNVHLGLLRIWLGEQSQRNQLILATLDSCLEDGRTVYVLTHSVAHAGWLHEQVDGSGLITGETKADERLPQLNDYNPVFATMDIGREAYNRKDLDTLLLLTPFAAYEHTAPALQQAVGRILRLLPGKKVPQVYLFVDDVEECRGLSFSLKKWAERQSYEVREEAWRKRKPKGW